MVFCGVAIVGVGYFGTLYLVYSTMFPALGVRSTQISNFARLSLFVPVSVIF